MPHLRAALAIVFLLAAAAPADAAFGPVGTLSQPEGQAGCVDAGGLPPCADTRAMSGTGRLGYPPDRSVMVVPGMNAEAAVLRRDPVTGVLSQSSTPAGCVARQSNSINCREARNLALASAAAFSPDGRHVYVAGANGLTAFDYEPDPDVGGLVPLPGADACWSEDGRAQPESADNACRNGRALHWATGVAVSPDGDWVYVAVNPAGSATDGVAILKRNHETGELTQGPGAQGCTTVTRTAEGDDATPQGCGGLLRAASDPFDLELSSDGSTMYLATRQGVVVLKRGADGTLSQPDGATGCIVSVPEAACTDGRALGEPYSLALSPDGRSLYVANSGVREVAHLRVASDGSLSQPEDAGGCVADTGVASDGPQPCGRARSLAGSQPGAGVSPDGRTVAIGGGNASGEVALLDRGPDGALSQAADTRGCVSRSGAATGTDGGDGRCATGAGTGGTDFMWSPAAHHFYASGGQSVAFFRREVAPACAGATAVTDSLTPVQVAFQCADANGDAVTLAVTGQGTKGTAGAPTADHKVTYTPKPDASGADAFLVAPTDASGNTGPTAAATVSIAFKSVLDPPRTAPLPRALTRVLRPDRKGRMRFALECPSAAPTRCAGRMTIVTARVRTRRGGKARRLRVMRVAYDLAPGQRKRFTKKTTRTLRAAMRLRSRIKLSVSLTATARPGYLADAATARATLRRPRR